jgi:hypothetical protein
MPIYIYQNPRTEECIEIIQSMNDEHKYIDDEGVEWKRVFLGSQLKTESSIDPWSNIDFIEKTRYSKDTHGGMLDRSAELSAKRAEQNGGIDPIKQKYFKDYAKKRNGKKHPQDRFKKVAENKHVKIELD